MRLFGSSPKSFLISVIIHTTAFFVLGVYLIVQHPKVQEIFETEFFEQKLRVRRRGRGPIVKGLPKPVVSTERPAVKSIQVKPRITSSMMRMTNIEAKTVLQFSQKYVSFDARINPDVPRIVNPSRPVERIVTHANLPVSDAPDALTFSIPVTRSSASGSPAISRGVAKSGTKVAQIARPIGLTMVANVGAKLDALESVVEHITLGDAEILPLPKGEPGGRIICTDKGIKGVFRFTRVRHSLSDWWADASSLNALCKWLNERTKIKTDMNVEGGAVKLTDANVMKCPLLFMTGHDPALVRSRNLLSSGGAGVGGKLDYRLSKQENAALRKYLIEKGGFLVFDDCGVNAPAQAMIRIFLGVLRQAMPEYAVQRLQPDHDIYNNFYEMGGPPIGFDIFWWSTHPPKRNYLEGVSVGEKLSALVVRRDYMCAMESVSLPTRSVHYSPGVYRFLTNVVVYSLTHGSIADYSDYVPKDTLAQKALPTTAPQEAKIKATP
ncbi:DUF4159 domain-containing protein [bacterium]|nr:DUF4159 domain-containing protein [bacterium]